MKFSFLAVLAAAAALAAGPPYPQGHIRLTWDDAVVKIGPDSGDNWPITWGDDDILYTSYGDGKGFADRATLSLGFAVDQVLYMFVRNYRVNDDFRHARLAWSQDRGRQWRWADWHFAGTFGCPEFVQFGPNYAGARDGFVYVVSQANDSALCPRPAVMEPRYRRPKAHLHGPAGHAARGHHLQRRAPPLLPDHWSGEFRTYHHKFPTKFMSADGKTMWLLYSGLDGGLYGFCLKKAMLE